MDLLLVLEHHFIRDKDGNVWCDRVIDRKYIERYLAAFENVTICGRLKEVKDVDESFEKVSGPKTYFLALPYFQGFSELRKNILKIIRIFKENVVNYKTVIFRAPSPLSIILFNFRNKKSPVGVEFVMGADKFFSNNSFFGRILNRYINQEAKKMCMKANGVSYVTERILQEKYPSLSIINGESEYYFDSFYSSVNLLANNYVEKNWNIKEKPSQFKLVHVGYMDSDRKGHEILIKALSILKEKNHNVELTFIGGGKLQDNFKELARTLDVYDSINFFGETNDKLEITKILSDSHLFILPSKSEGLPRVIIEAMATGTPCIGSNVDGIPELIDEDLIVDDFEPISYAEKIEEVLSDWSKMIRISNDNFEKSKKFQDSILEDRRKRFYLKLKNLQQQV